MNQESTEPKVEYQCCLQKIKENLAKHHGGEVSLELGQFIETPDDDAQEVSFVMGYNPLFYRWMEKKKVRKGHVQFRFCPMCGKPL